MTTFRMDDVRTVGGMGSENMTYSSSSKRTPGFTRVLIAVLLILFILYLPSGGLYWLTLVNLAAITGIGAMGLTVLIGTAGLLSLGQAAFLAIGGFTAALLVTFSGAGFLTCLVVGGSAAALVGVVVAAATARTVGIYLAVGTLALHYVVEILLSDIEVKVTSALGFQMDVPRIFGWEVATEQSWWYVLCVMVFGFWLLLRWIVRGQPGRNWVCIRENAAVASSLGMSVIKSRMAVFALSSFVAGVAGVLHGFYLGTVQITNYSLHMSIVYLTIVVLGRPGSVGGALWAAAFITVLPQLLSWFMRVLGVDVISYGAGAESIALSLILALFLLQVPQRILTKIRSRGSV